MKAINQYLSNPNGAKASREVVRTLNRLGLERVGRRQYNRLEAVGRRLFTDAAKGNVPAATLIFHYIAGKPKETVDVTVGPSEMMLKLVRMIGQGALDDKGEAIDALAIEHQPDPEVSE